MNSANYVIIAFCLLVAAPLVAIVGFLNGSFYATMIALAMMVALCCIVAGLAMRAMCRENTAARAYKGKLNVIR